MAYERKRQKKIIIENTRMIYRPNFSGEPDKFNPDGAPRNFNIVLDENNPNAKYGTCADDMQQMKIKDLKKDGWNIRETKPDEDGNVTYFLNVTASYKRRGPHIIKAIGSTKVRVDEDNISDLDSDFVENIDYISINAFEWEPGRIKAYLRDMHITVEDDPFMRKYGSEFAEDFEDEEEIPF